MTVGSEKHPLVAAAVLILSCGFLVSCDGATPPQSGSDTEAVAAGNVDYPAFPWPPPKWSAREVVAPELLLADPQAETSLDAVNRRLNDALEAAGYFETSYYSIRIEDRFVPDSFVLVTKLEQINPDGTSKEGPDRWSTQLLPLREFSLVAYLRALFTADPGRYRVITFIVTSLDFSSSETELSAEEAEKLVGGGLGSLPGEIGEQVFTERHTCHALIYEFQKSRVEEEVEPVSPGDLQARTHLEKAKIWQALER